MAEWLKAHAWKACIPQGIQGSNPCLSAITFRHYFFCHKAVNVRASYSALCQGAWHYVPHESAQRNVSQRAGLPEGSLHLRQTGCFGGCRETRSGMLPSSPRRPSGHPSAPAQSLFSPAESLWLCLGQDGGRVPPGWPAPVRHSPSAPASGRCAPNNHPGHRF